MKPAIVLSGHTMALGVVRALGSMGVSIVNVHYDEKDIAHVSRYVKDCIIAPHPEKQEEQFVRLLIKIADRYGGGVLFPVSDESVVAVARNKERLIDHFLVACPEWDVVSQYIDKKYTYALAEKNGVPAPKTIVPKTVEDVEKYSKTVEFPCLVKPSQSHLFYEQFKCKMYPVNSADQMISVYRKAADAGLEVMLQEIIPGDDAEVVNYNAYFEDGEPLVEFTAEHVRNAPPWWGSPRVALSANIPEVIAPGRKILRAMNFYGYACTEFKRDTRDGIYKLMEINGRHNLSTLLSVRCGINFPWIQHQHLSEGIKPFDSDFESGIYWIDIVRDVGYSLKFLTQERYSLGQYLRPYVKPHVYAIFDLKDIRPFIKRCTYLVRQAAKHLLDYFRKSPDNK